MDELPQVLKDIRFIYESSEGRSHVETRGLEKVGLPNVQMVNVPAGTLERARGFMLEVAGHTVMTRPLRAGQTIGVPWHCGVNLARAVEAPSIGEDPRPVLRLIAPEPGRSQDQAPLLALATELVEEALDHLDVGRLDVARDSVERSIELYPGEPGLDDPALAYNTENHRAYAVRHMLTDDIADLRKALDRSPAYFCRTLGIPRAELEQCEASDIDGLGQIIADVRQLVLRAHDERRPQSDGVAAVMSSPILVYHPAAGTVTVGLCAGPDRWLDLFFRGPARERLERDDTCRFLADAIVAHRERAEVLASTCQVASSLWTRCEVERGPSPLSVPLEPAHLYTGLLAAVGMCAAAGCTELETRAWFCLDDSADNAAASAKVTRLLRDCEAELERVRAIARARKSS